MKTGVLTVVLGQVIISISLSCFIFFELFFIRFFTGYGYCAGQQSNHSDPYESNDYFYYDCFGIHYIMILVKNKIYSTVYIVGDDCQLFSNTQGLAV